MVNKILLKKKYFVGQNIILVCIILSALLSLSSNGIIKKIVIAIALIELFVIIYQVRIRSSFSKYSMILYFGWVGLLIWHLLCNSSGNLISTSVQQILLLSLLFFNFKKNSDLTQWNFICERLLVFFILIDLVYRLIYGYDYFSMYIYAISFYVLLHSKWKKKKILLLALIMYICKARSTVLALGVIFTIYISWKYISKKKTYLNFAYWIYVFLLIGLPRFYCWLWKSEYASSLNLFVRKYTGKNFFSGRQLLWSQAIQIIDNNRWFGVGGNYEESILETLGCSVHNLFLFLQLEGGYFLLGIFLLMFYWLWRKMYLNLSGEVLMVSCGYVIGLLLRVSFDLSFLANNFAQSVVLWTPIVSILGLCQCSKNEIKVR